MLIESGMNATAHSLIIPGIMLDAALIARFASFLPPGTRSISSSCCCGLGPGVCVRAGDGVGEGVLSTARFLFRIGGAGRDATTAVVCIFLKCWDSFVACAGDATRCGAAFSLVLGAGGGVGGNMGSLASLSSFVTFLAELSSALEKASTPPSIPNHPVESGSPSWSIQRKLCATMLLSGTDTACLIPRDMRTKMGILIAKGTAMVMSGCVPC